MNKLAEEQSIRLSQMAGSVVEFAKECYLVEPGAEKTKFELWSHLVQYFREHELYQFLLVLKSKQIGISWASALLALHHIYFTPHGNVLEISQGDYYAQQLLNKSKILYFNLPLWMQRKTLEPNSTEAFGFKELGSRIRAFPSTETACLGETASLVIHDEWDFHDYAMENYAHTKATAQMEGKLIGVSTVNKSKPDSFFKNQYKLARDGQNEFKTLFFDYSSRPERNIEWYNRERKIAEDSGSLWMFEQNYPRTEVEALSPQSAQSAFNRDTLNILWENVCEYEVRQGCIYILQKPMVGWVYSAGVDVAQGVGGDYSACTIIGKYGGQASVVAVIYSNQIATDWFAYQVNQLCEEYHDPLLGVENNSIGVAVVNKLLELNQKNLFYSDSKKSKPGWTTGAANKNLAIAELIQNVNNRSLVTRFKPMVQELMEYQVINGKYEPTGKTHGDLVISLAIANQMDKRVRSGREITVYDRRELG